MSPALVHLAARDPHLLQLAGRVHRRHGLHDHHRLPVLHPAVHREAGRDARLLQHHAAAVHVHDPGHHDAPPRRGEVDAARWSCSSPCRCATGRSWSASSWRRWRCSATALGLTLVFAITVATLGPLDRGPAIGGYLGLLLMGGAYVAIGVMASSFTRNSIVAFIVAFAISFALYLFGRLDAVRRREALQRARRVPQHRRPLREHQPRRHRHPRRHLLPVGDRRQPARGDALARVAEVESSHGRPGQDDDRRRRTGSQMDARKRVSASNATAYVLLTIGAIVAVNLIATRVFGRLDLTENKRLHAVAGLEGPGHEPARLPDGQGLHLEGSAARADRRQPLRARPARRVPDLLEGQAALRGHRSRRRQEARGRGDASARCSKLQIQVHALAEVRGRLLLPGPLLPVPGARTRRSREVDAARGARVPDLLAHQADDPAEAQAGVHHRPRRGGPQPGLHVAQARPRAGVRDHHREPLVGAHRRRRRRAGRRRPQAAVRRQGPPGDRRLPDEGARARSSWSTGWC